MRVLLTRPAERSEDLGSILQAHGIGCVVESMLDIVPEPWDGTILPVYQAVLVTSLYASRALLEARRVDRDLRIFAVGPATARPLLQAGFTDVPVAGGTAESMIGLVRREADPTAGRLLYLSGLHISRDLVSALTPEGFAVDRSVVYRAVAVTDMSATLRREIDEGRIDAVVLFSVRTAMTFRRLMVEANLVGACAGMTAIAFSSRIAEALAPLRFRHLEIAASPHLDDAIDAVLRARDILVGRKARHSDPGSRSGAPAR